MKIKQTRLSNIEKESFLPTTFSHSSLDKNYVVHKANQRIGQFPVSAYISWEILSHASQSFYSHDLTYKVWLLFLNKCKNIYIALILLQYFQLNGNIKPLSAISLTVTEWLYITCTRLHSLFAFF